MGIRAEFVDLTEILRRINLEIYDKAEYEKVLARIKANCKGTQKEWWNMTDADIKACLDATDWCRAYYAACKKYGPMYR